MQRMRKATQHSVITLIQRIRELRRVKSSKIKFLVIALGYAIKRAGIKIATISPRERLSLSFSLASICFATARVSRNLGQLKCAYP